MYPKYGALKKFALHGEFSFKDFDDICWEYDQQGEHRLILYLPVANIDNFFREALRRTSFMNCNLKFCKEKKETLVQGEIVKHSGITVLVEEDNRTMEMVLIKFDKETSSRFLKFMTRTKTQVIDRSLIEGIAVRPKRKHARVAKKYQILYSLDIPGMIMQTENEITLEGESTDISQEGIFVQSEFLPPLNAEIKFLMYTDKNKIVEARGQVIRRIDKTPESGFGLKVLQKKETQDLQCSSCQSTNLLERGYRNFLCLDCRETFTKW